MIVYVKRCARQGRRGERLLVLVDSRVARGSIKKGRSSSRAVNRRLRVLAAWCLGYGFYLEILWIASDANSSDAPSRRRSLASWRQKPQALEEEEAELLRLWGVIAQQKQPQVGAVVGTGLKVILISLIDGIGGATAALRMAGVEAWHQGLAEGDTDCVKILMEQHKKRTTLLEDVRLVDDTLLRHMRGALGPDVVVLIVAGSPCQDLSGLRGAEAKGLSVGQKVGTLL